LHVVSVKAQTGNTLPKFHETPCRTCGPAPVMLDCENVPDI